MSVVRVLPCLLGGLLAVAACGSGPGADPAAPDVSSGAAGEGLGGGLTVFAAASLTDVFTEIGELFEAEHEDVTVTFSFGASSGLAQQVVSGAPADVFAAASPATMAQVTDAGLAAREPTVVARNRLQVAVPADNPGGVTGLADLADEALLVALCAEEVPCGAAAAQVFDAAGLTPAPDTYEKDVRAALTKVVLGEVDAALVYRTDVRAAGDTVRGIDVPEGADAANDYPVTVLAEAPNPDAAEAFVAFVLSDDARAVLDDAGFDLP